MTYKALIDLALTTFPSSSLLPITSPYIQQTFIEHLINAGTKNTMMSKVDMAPETYNLVGEK